MFGTFAQKKWNLWIMYQSCPSYSCKNNETLRKYFVKLSSPVLGETGMNHWRPSQVYVPKEEEYQKKEGKYECICEFLILIWFCQV